MKNKIIYVLIIIGCMGLSMYGTIFIMDYKLDHNKCNCENTSIKNVSVVEENTLKSSIDKVYDSVVYVGTYYRSDLAGSGTGFVYKTDDEYGYVLTNHHVISGNYSVKVTNNDGQTVDATVLGSDEFADIAVLRIPVDAVIGVASIGESSLLNIGDTVFVVGSPLGSKYMGTVTKGILSGKDRLVNVQVSSGYYVMNVLQTDAAVNPGNSGGPLVNINGEVIGIISMKLVEDKIEGMGFAIPIEVANSYVEKLEKGEAVERPVLGIEYTDVTSSYNLYLHRIRLSSKVKYGVVITETIAGYPAEKIGLEKGDVIIAIDNNKISDSSYYRYILYKYDIGDKINITYIRGEEEKTVEVTLDKSA